MKKLLFAIFALIVVGSFVLTAPVYASDNAWGRKTPTRPARITATPTTQETAKQVFYTAVWNTCLTTTVQEHPSYSMSEITPICRETLQLMQANNAYENRHSDMWQPVPADLRP